MPRSVESLPGDSEEGKPQYPWDPPVDRIGGLYGSPERWLGYKPSDEELTEALLDCRITTNQARILRGIKPKMSQEEYERLRESAMSAFRSYGSNPTLIHLPEPEKQMDGASKAAAFAFGAFLMMAFALFVVVFWSIIQLTLWVTSK